MRYNGANQKPPGLLSGGAPYPAVYVARGESMLKIRKKILKDHAEKPIAVQIDYADWLEIERSLNLRGEEIRETDLSKHAGVIALSEEPLEYQSRIRQEWS
jgi:hypothetical protein